jgi:hypothetical protein
MPTLPIEAIVPDKWPDDFYVDCDSGKFSGYCADFSVERLADLLERFAQALRTVSPDPGFVSIDDGKVTAGMFKIVGDNDHV